MHAHSRVWNMSQATALGASVPHAERIFLFFQGPKLKTSSLANIHACALAKAHSLVL